MSETIINQTKYLIIGGGVAGTSAAETLREKDPHGTITIVSEEPYRFYSRIMLSKPAFLLGKIPFDKIWLKDDKWYEEKKINLVLGKSAVKLDPQQKIVTLDDNQVWQYEKLLLAIGGKSRLCPVPGTDKQGIFYLRNLDDAKGLITKVKSSQKALVIGGGFVSFEACEVLKKAGLEVNLILREKYFWEPVLDATAGKLAEQAMEKGGVKIHRQTEVREIKGVRQVEGVILKDGSSIDTDLIVVCIGTICPFEWLKTTGLEINRGICTNKFLATNLPDIWAIGDGAEFFYPISGERTQIQNWSNGQMQGKIAALNMLGEKQIFDKVTSCTAIGFGMTLGFIGDTRMDENRQMINRDLANENAYEQIILKDGKIVGGILINKPTNINIIMKLIESRLDLSGKLNELGDPNYNLENLLTNQIDNQIIKSGKKIAIGWFSFSCSEDSTIIFTELMNEHWQHWKKMFDFRYARVLQSHNVLDKLDIAFIEGAIASEKQADKLRDIRSKSLKLVAVGACAVTGMPAGQRNNFNETQKQTIQPLVEKFNALPRVLKVSEVVKVDASVPGCPMDAKMFIDTLNKLTTELKAQKII